MRAELHFSISELFKGSGFLFFFFLLLLKPWRPLVVKNKQFRVYKKRVLSKVFSCFGIKIVSISLHGLWARSFFSTKFFFPFLLGFKVAASLSVSKVENLSGLRTVMFKDTFVSI